MNFIRLTTVGNLHFHEDRVIYLNIDNIVYMSSPESYKQLNTKTEIRTVDGGYYNVIETTEDILSRVQTIKSD